MVAALVDATTGIVPAVPPSAAKTASTSQYGSGLKARISSSRRVMIASVGVCTRPRDTAPSNDERRRIVAARVAFMPTIQSDSERERAAASREANSDAGRSSPNARSIALFVIEDSHKRCTDFFDFAFSKR